MRLNCEQKLLVVGQIQAGRRKGDVARHFGISARTVTRILAKFNYTGTVKDLPQSGRPRVTTQREDAFIAHDVITFAPRQSSIAKCKHGVELANDGFLT